MISQPGDEYEQEAESIAADVTGQMDVSQCQDVPRRKPTENEGETLHSKPMVRSVYDASGSSGLAATPDLASTIRSTRGHGYALPGWVRKPMEQSFRADFSGVRIHVDADSHRLSRSLHARAFAVGRDIYFRRGIYNPHSQSGRELLAHELVHVMQQQGQVRIQRNWSNIADGLLQGVTPVPSQALRDRIVAALRQQVQLSGSNAGDWRQEALSRGVHIQLLPAAHPPPGTV